MGQGLAFHTAVQPCMARKEGIARAMSEGPSLWTNRVLERWLMRISHFGFPWPGQMPVLKLEGKNIIKICLPPSQIYLFPFDKQWFHFSSRPNFFFFLFQTEPRPTWQKALCSCPYLSNTPPPRPHHHSGNKSLPSPAAAKGELPNTTFPQPKHTLLKINIAFSFLFF